MGSILRSANIDPELSFAEFCVPVLWDSRVFAICTQVLADKYQNFEAVTIIVLVGLR
jgi:hypothetical protein